MDESQKEDEEVAKELADEQEELVEVVEQAIGRKINKTDLSYLISNNEEIIADKDADIFDEIVERLGSPEPESEEEEASIPVLAKEAIQAVQLLQKWEAQQDRSDLVFMTQLRDYELWIIELQREQHAKGKQRQVTDYFTVNSGQTDNL